MTGLLFDVRVVAPLTSSDVRADGISDEAAAVEVAREMLARPRVEHVTVEAAVAGNLSTFAICHFRFGELPSAVWSCWVDGQFIGHRRTLEGWPG